MTTRQKRVEARKNELTQKDYEVSKHIIGWLVALAIVLLLMMPSLVVWFVRAFK